MAGWEFLPCLAHFPNQTSMFSLGTSQLAMFDTGGQVMKDIDMYYTTLLLDIFDYMIIMH